jgi:hypothetical protein
VPALKTVLRPDVPSWRRPAVLPPWEREDEDPEQLARETIANLRGALAGLEAIRKLLRSP